MKRILSLCIVLSLILSLASCNPSPKDFSKDGMTITLTDAFSENTMGGYTVCYDSRDVAVFVLKESFSLFAEAGITTLEEYAELVHSANALRSPGEITLRDGLTTMEYSFHNDAEGKTYKYFSVMLKGPDAFWLVQFACVDAAYDSKLESFVEWAKSVRFDN